MRKRDRRREKRMCSFIDDGASESSSRLPSNFHIEWQGWIHVKVKNIGADTGCEVVSDSGHVIRKEKNGNKLAGRQEFACGL